MRARSFLILAALLAAFGLSTSCQQKPDPAPQPLPPPPLEYLGEWGVKGDGPGQFSRPVWLATDFAGNVYVADAGNGFVHKFDPQGRPLLSFEEHRLKQPTGVAVDRGGAIYVTDAQRGSVFIFLPDGERFREIRTRAEKGSPVPVSIAVDDEGNLYVVERASNQIQKFNPRGRLLKTWGLKADDAGQLLFPAGVAVGPDGFLYVVDRQGTHVQKLTREGEFVSGWTKPQSELRVDDSPDVRSGIAVSEKYVFLADAVNHGVQVWTLDGQPKLADDLGGRLRSGTDTSFQVAFSPRGELLILDFVGIRVLRFRINF